MNIKLDFIMFLCVSYSEKVPLSMSVSVNVILKKHIILVVRNFNTSKEISTFKPRLEYKSFIIITSRIVVREWRWRGIMGILNGCISSHLNHIIALYIVILNELFDVNKISGCLSRDGNLTVSKERTHLPF